MTFEKVEAVYDDKGRRNLVSTGEPDVRQVPAHRPMRSVQLFSWAGKGQLPGRNRAGGQVCRVPKLEDGPISAALPD